MKTRKNRLGMVDWDIDYQATPDNQSTTKPNMYFFYFQMGKMARIKNSNLPPMMIDGRVTEFHTNTDFLTLKNLDTDIVYRVDTYLVELIDENIQLNTGICPKCNTEIKERPLFNGSFIGCMC